MKTAPLLRFVSTLVLLTFLSSCGSAFRQAWRQAPQSTAGVEGRWEGTWQSAASGHHGTLRCAVTGPINPAGDHDFYYHATWKHILSGSYKAPHSVQKKGTVYVFKGQHKMPDWAGGLYHYEGTIDGNVFKACYKSGADHGTYTLKRVP